MPPGSAKCTYAVDPVCRPGTWRGFPQVDHRGDRTPSELAEHWGRRIRNMIGEHGPTLGIELAEGQQAAGRWALTPGGAYPQPVLAAPSLAFVLTRQSLMTR